MSKIQGLRVLVKLVLSAAGDEIVEAVEKMMAGYEEEMFQSKREISQQRKMLDALLQPEIKLNTIAKEAQLNLSVWEEDFLTQQQQEWNSSPSQKNPESLQTERSHKEPLSSSQDRRPEDDTTHDTFTPQCVKHEYEIYKEEEEPVPVTSAEQMPIENDEEVPSPGFSELEIDNDKARRLSDATEDEDGDSNEATQDGDIDRREELTNSGRHCMLTAKTPPRMNKKANPIFCKVCGRTFHAKFSLVNHLEIHPKDVCGLCGRHFETEESFRLHLKTHVEVKTGACVLCGKCFCSPSALTIHMRTHTGEKPFSCTACGKSFTLHSNMIRHRRVHTGVKPYSCTKCKRCYSDLTYFKRHKCRLQKRTLAKKKDHSGS